MHAADSTGLPIPSPQSFLVTLKSLSSDASSESEVEEEAVLQPSSSIDSLVPLTDTSSHLDTPEWANRQSPTHSKSTSPKPRMQLSPAERSPLTVTSRAPRASELPDLISFDMSASARSPPHPDATAPNQASSSSSCATVDDLLSFSPQPPKSQSPLGLFPQDQTQALEARPVPVSQNVTSVSLPSLGKIFLPPMHISSSTNHR